jgi:DNA-binding NarL/FixJ family response regulator
MNMPELLMTTTKKILLIDDQILFREGLIGLFSSTADFVVVGAAGSVHEGKEMALLHKPDIILMDFSLPDGTGLDATRAIIQHLPECKIIFLTVYETDENLFAALRMGAMGYMLKNITGSDLLSSLRALDRGEKAISRKMASSVLDEFSRIEPVSESGSSKQRLLAKLSPREIDVLREMESDATNLQIAQRLFLSENTVKHHIRNILDKLEVENRREAIIFARQNALGSKFSSQATTKTDVTNNNDA